ncbi:GNAT family N-acetyltransferase [Halobaculum sp. D14]|uniref:GNAT family N-acetyltransferase n=1 Tax=Halobaculum sp. D14 TaxID=3421642 RepID=UPI003EBC6596
MQIREARRGDAAAVASLARTAWHAAYGDFLSAEAIDATVDAWYDPSELRRDISGDGTFLVADADAASHGDEQESAVSAADSDDADDASLVGFGHARYSSGVGNVVLRRLYVHPDEWGCGVGTALLGELARRFRADGHSRLSAVVLAENDVGLSFYDSHAFEEIGRQTTSFAGEEHDECIVAASLADLTDLGPV